jgi:hypothetical protein
MRIGSIRDRRVAGFDHALGKIRVRVDDADDRNPGADLRSQLRQPEPVEIAVVSSLTGVGP